MEESKSAKRSVTPNKKTPAKKSVTPDKQASGKKSALSKIGASVSKKSTKTNKSKALDKTGDHP